jgi:hypothetical protein
MIKMLITLAAFAAAAPCYAQEVRVLSGGGIEHVYGPGGEVLDSPQLREKNQRAKRQTQERSAGIIEQQRLSTQQSGPHRGPDSWWTNNAERRQPSQSWWNNNGYEPPKSAWRQ